MFHRCLISSCLLGWHLKTFTAFPSAASCHSIISSPRHKVGLVSEISQSYPHPPDPKHLYNPLPVCVFTYKGSLSWLLRMSLWCMACCSQSPLHLRMGLVPSVPKQPGKFHCESAKVRQFIVVALPSECPGHRATHCASVQFRCVLKD